MTSSSENSLPNFIVMSSECFNGSLELVRDVQLVCVEEEKNAIHAFREPLEDPDELVPSVDTLLLTAQDSGGINDSDTWK